MEGILKLMSDFPTYILDLKLVNTFIEDLRLKGVSVEKTADMHVAAQGSHYKQYEAIFENGGKLVFWINIYPSKDEILLRIGNPSGRLGKDPLQSAFQILDGLGSRLGAWK
jgi:hypothetical protein